MTEMDGKVKIMENSVQETMLIPLTIKASETLRSKPRIRDEKAVEIIRQLKADTDKYDKFMSHEGVLMYFAEEQVRQLLDILSAAFDEYTLLAELNSTVMINQEKYHDTVKSTGAVFRWGLNHGKELETMCRGLLLLRENSFNDVMKKYTFRGWLFGSLPKLREFNDRLAVYRYSRPGGRNRNVGV